MESAIKCNIGNSNRYEKRRSSSPSSKRKPSINESIASTSKYMWVGLAVVVILTDRIGWASVAKLLHTDLGIQVAVWLCVCALVYLFFRSYFVSFFLSFLFPILSVVFSTDNLNASAEWKELSHLSEDPHLVQLRYLAVTGGLKTSKFRSICWSLLLGVLNGRSQSWCTQRRCDRSRKVIW